jgi:hypothetical protein
MGQVRQRSAKAQKKEQKRRICRMQNRLVEGRYRFALETVKDLLGSRRARVVHAHGPDLASSPPARPLQASGWQSNLNIF